MQIEQRPSALSAGLMNGSMLLYLFWLLLPAVQTTGRAMTGAAAVGLFGLGALLDTSWLKAHWPRTLLRALCAAAMPFVWRAFMGRGGDNAAGFYVQQGMFWFPLVFAGYARERGDSRLWRGLRPLLIAVLAITTLTTIGWLVQGMLRGGRVYAYSRSLGYGGEGREAYLKELMLRNIGGYDFIYAAVAALPLWCLGIQRTRGWRRAAFAALLAAQTVMIVLSQYTYAMLFAACLLAVEGLALLIRAASRGKVGMGASLCLGAVPLLAVVLLRVPLVTLAADLCAQLGLASFEKSFRLLLDAMSGTGAAAASAAAGELSRLDHYRVALEGFAASPLLGSLLGGAKRLSLHSDLLDVLSGVGLVGAAAMGGMLWLMGRGTLRGVGQSPSRAQLVMCLLAVLATAALGTVVYSRDVMAVLAMGALLVLEGERKRPLA